MPYDGFFTKCMVKELSTLIDSRIDKIHQPSRDEIYLYFKKDRKNVKLMLCANPAYPRVQLTEEQRENPHVAPNFCMILRKHLSGARLAGVSQINFDRIIELKFESRDELGFAEDYSIVAEIMGKHSNIIFLNKDRRILDCIKHIGCDVNRYREVLPGVNYILPPTGEKFNPLMATKENFMELFDTESNSNIEKLITDRFLGVSRLIATEICGKYAGLAARELAPENLAELADRFFTYISKAKSEDFQNIIYLKDGTIHDYYVFDLDCMGQSDKQTAESCSQILDMFYGSKGRKDSLKQKFTDLFRLVSNLADRNSKKLQIHALKLDECKDYEKWKIYADIIMANQYQLNENMTCAVLDNFYDPEFSKVEIPLEAGLSPVLNAQKYYRRYNKEKTTIEYVEKQLEECKNEVLYLDSISYNLENANDVDTIEEIRREMSELGYIKKKRTNQKQQKSKPHHYRSSDGYDIYVGKNNVQNDYLTTKFADSSDIWMHTKDIPGSHVIIKCKANTSGKGTLPPSDTALLEGALLAAYYSKARSSTGVPVDYTEKKNVKKPNGAKPGMVIYLTNKTAYVNPSEEKIKRLELHT